MINLIIAFGIGCLAGGLAVSLYYRAKYDPLMEAILKKNRELSESNRFLKGG